VDVYELILEKGTIGALKYAQDIEQKNYRIASKIDSAVAEIYSFTKFAQGDDPFTDPDSPLSPNTESNQKRPINFNDLGLEGADTAAKWLAFKNSRKLFYNLKINEFVLNKSIILIHLGPCLQSTCPINCMRTCTNAK